MKSTNAAAKEIFEYVFAENVELMHMLSDIHVVCVCVLMMMALRATVEKVIADKSQSALIISKAKAGNRLSCRDRQ